MRRLGEIRRPFDDPSPDPHRPGTVSDVPDHRRRIDPERQPEHRALRPMPPAAPQRPKLRQGWLRPLAPAPPNSTATPTWPLCAPPVTSGSPTDRPASNPNVRRHHVASRTGEDPPDYMNLPSALDQMNHYQCTVIDDRTRIQGMSPLVWWLGVWSNICRARPRSGG